LKSVNSIKFEVLTLVNFNDNTQSADKLRLEAFNNKN